MPFIRYTRDKRGYETTYVMHAYRSAQSAGRTRVLYFFRSPAHVRIGRRPLDEELREALAHTHPDLSFDWTALAREQSAPRFDERDRDHRDHREHREHRGDRDRHRSGRQAPPPHAQPQAPPAVVIDDQTLLGKTLGGAQAARLRTRYNEILQRILRRSRSAEERDRLTEQMQRLNPDDWADAADIRTGAQTVDASWDAIVAELPARRRGRRGGRRRQGDRPEAEAGGGAAGPADASGIMEPEGSEHTDAGAETEAGSADWAADAPGDGDGLGADPDADGAAGDRLPLDDELRHD